METLYKDYFNIDPKYYAAVTADLIEQGKVSWKNFYPHETFIELLQTTYRVLSGNANRSIWVEGAYGTGKSHAALTIKSIIEANPEEIKEYFDEYGLSKDLRDKYISLRSNSNILTIHRIGSAGINSDTDLILAVQQSIMDALKKRGIENQGDASMRDAFLSWVSKKANYNYFSELISDEKYAWDFNGASVENIVDRLNNGTRQQIEQTMTKVMKVLKDAGQYGIFTDINQMSEWINSIIQENHLSAILFIWDEFSEYFLTHPVGLTGFQTLAEISLSHPFYFMIVAHESRNLFQNRDTANKTLDRFEKPIKIELPENMAFKLMAKAMKTTDDPILKPKWISYKSDLNEELINVRNTIENISKKQNKFGIKNLISDEELQNIVPIHPYAALVLKNIAVLFNSNQRSMFDFIISDDVRGILDNFTLLNGTNLLPDEQRVLKTILLLQAVSLRVTGNELLVPDDQNVELSFEGTEDWNKGKALALANSLCKKGLIFKKPVAGGKTEFCVASAGPSVDIEPIRKKVTSETKTTKLITDGQLSNAIKIPANIKDRYIVETTGYSGFNSAINSLLNKNKRNRFKIIETFALDENELAQIEQLIIKQMNMPNNEIFFVESLAPFGKDLLDQYVESMTFSYYNAGKDNEQSKHFEQQALNVLTNWRDKITNGAFNIYIPDTKIANRKASLADLQMELNNIDRKVYFCGIEQYHLSDTMFTSYQLANGAGFGIEEKTSGAYHNNNPKLSLETALDGAWKVEKYWEDSSKQSLPIVHIKQKVNEIIEVGFNSSERRASIDYIVQSLTEPPFGLLPNSASAFVLGFVLKEYATSDYYWSDNSNSEPMSSNYMKLAIANALNQLINSSSKYKEEFIVQMSSQTRAFLNCTEKVFHTGQIGSVESARDQIRLKMKELSFPIWCLKYLDEKNFGVFKDDIIQIIDAYCGIANVANGGESSESSLADNIGSIVSSKSDVETILESLFTSKQCQKGMVCYLEFFRDGLLPKLAAEIGDGGNYIDIVKSKFSADDANWVWNKSTVDDKISDVILEYEIVIESRKSLGKFTGFEAVSLEWNKKTNQIRMPYESLNKITGDLGAFLEQLYFMKTSGGLSEENKQKFYELLLTQRESFEDFYKNQIPYFKQDADAFLGGLDDTEIESIYLSFPSGQFTNTKSEYYNFIQAQIDTFVKSQWKKKLKDLWFSKTHTKDPEDWSIKYETPILCMFDDSERTHARDMFTIMLQTNPTESDAKEAIEWLSNATFYEKLANNETRDKCFLERIIGDNAVLLDDIQKVRDELLNNLEDSAYYWMDNTAVNNHLKKMVDKQYKLSGCDKALAVIDNMSPEQLKKYLYEKIQDDAEFGIQILKHQ